MALRTGAALPKHQVGFGSDHIGVKPLEHIDDFFAADTTVEYGDRVAGKTLLEFDGEAAGVGRCRGTSAETGGRRAAEKLLKNDMATSIPSPDRKVRDKTQNS